MLLVKINDQFLSEKLIDLCNQKNLQISNDSNIKHHAVLNIQNNNSYIEVSCSGNTNKLNYPFSFNQLLSLIVLHTSEIFIQYQELRYNPFQHLVIFNKKKLQLGSIHNLIFSNLILFQKEGLLKNQLYNILWPNDKNIQINKIDTHLTNLKNILSDKIKFKLSYTTIKGKINLF